MIPNPLFLVKIIFLIEEMFRLFYLSYLRSGINSCPAGIFGWPMALTSDKNFVPNVKIPTRVTVILLNILIVLINIGINGHSVVGIVSRGKVGDGATGDTDCTHQSSQKTGDNPTLTKFDWGTGFDKLLNDFDRTVPCERANATAENNAEKKLSKTELSRFPDNGNGQR